MVYKVVRLLTVEQEVDGFPYLFVLNLAVEVFVYYLGPLLGCNIAQQIRAEISRDSDIVCRPGIAGGVDETGIQTKQNMCFDLACLDLVCLHVMTVEQIDGLSYHFHVAQLLRRDIHKQILDLGVSDAETLGHILHGSF